MGGYSFVRSLNEDLQSLRYALNAYTSPWLGT